MDEKKRNAHHLWTAQRDESGKVKVIRSKREPDEFDKKREAAAACWGLWGASLVDDEMFSSEIPKGIVARLNEVTSEPKDRIYSWAELKKAFGEDTINEVRKDISGGIKIRQASKYLDIPFIMAAELIDRFGSASRVEGLVKIARSGGDLGRYGSKGRLVQDIYRKYSRKGLYKLAVDEKAKRYFEDYYGTFGKELVREIKKRVRADLASTWLRKNGVDEKAVSYWTNYFLWGYGEDLVKDLAKKLSPAK